MNRISIVIALAGLSAGTALVAGCGSGGGGGTPAPGAGSNSLNGTVTVPADQVAQLPAGRSVMVSLVRSFDLFGTPADAASTVTEKPLPNAVVTLRMRSNGQVVPTGTTVTTDSQGNFTIPNPPSLTDLEVDATNGSVEVKAPVLPGQASNVAVNEVTTVGAEAAEEAETEGASPTDADQVAQQVESDQDASEEANPGQNTPDLHTNNPNPNRGPRHLADQHLTGHLGEKLSATQSQPDAHNNQQAVMAAVAYARTHFGTSDSLLDPAAIRTLSQGPAFYTGAQVATALVNAGVTGASADSVDAQLALLNTALASDVPSAKIPAALALLLLLQPGTTATPNPLQLTTSSSLDSIVSGLTGSTVGSSVGADQGQHGANGSGSGNGSQNGNAQNGNGQNGNGQNGNAQGHGSQTNASQDAGSQDAGSQDAGSQHGSAGTSGARS